MKRRMLLGVCLCAGSALATLSGTIKLPAGTGLAGVSVSLRKTSATAVLSGSNGQWNIASVAIGDRAPSSPRPLPSSLRLDNGHLAVNLQGVGADGRRLSPPAANLETVAFAGRTAAVVDTLVFSMGGIVKATLPIGTLDSTGIVTTIDTATPAVDQGTTTTTWASGCADTKVACTSGTWTAGGPDPDHTAFKLIKESDHFAIYSDEAITDASATSALNTLETVVWAKFFNPPINMPEPLCNSSTKVKASIHVHSDWGLTGGSWATGRMGMWIGTGGLADHWGLAHEFTHAWQSVSGGLQCNQSNTCGWTYESHANFTPHQLPEYANNVHCSEMLANAPHVYLGSTRDRYCNWQFMEFLKDKECYKAVNDIWTGTAGADPFSKIMTTRGWTVSQLNDFFGEWAMHNITWDYKTSASAFRGSYGSITDKGAAERMHRLTQMEALDSSWTTNRRFVSPFHGAPQRWGYNVVRLHPEAGATTVTVTFRGVVQAAANTDFRWGLVATNTGFTTSRYSALQRGTDGAVTFKVNTGEPLFLVVLGSPSKFQSITWDQAYNSIYRYPYMIQLANAWPEGFQSGKLDACASGLVRHSNGGGCAPSGTASSVYVGPHATVRAGTTVSGSARIEDQAVVYRGSVTGGTVGGLSVIGANNAFAVSGTPNVRTTFYPLGFYEGNQGVSGTANVFGDVEYRGDGLNKSSGNYSGMVEAATTSMTGTDVTVKGPYAWRP